MEKIGRAIGRNTLLLVTTEFSSKLISILLIMAVARTLGPAAMGIYAFGLAFISIFAILVNFGFVTYIQREVGRSPQNAGQLFAQIFCLQVVIYLVCISIILPTSIALADTTLKKLVVWTLSAALFFQTSVNVTNAFFRAHLKVKYEAIVLLTMRITYAGAGLTALLSGQGLLTLVSIELIAWVGACFLGWWFFIKKIGNPFHRIRWSDLRDLIGKTREFLFIRILQTIFNTVDMLMLSVMAGDIAAGLYGAALRLISAFDFLPSAFTGAYFPAMSQVAHGDRSAFYDICKPYYKYLFIIGLGLALALGVFAEGLIGLLFGTEFLPAAKTLVILALGQIILFANWPLSNAIIALNRERKIRNVFGGCAVFSICMNVILIPHFKNDGSALAFLVSQSLLLCLQLHILGWDFARRMNLGMVSGRAITAALLALCLACVIGVEKFNVFVGAAVTGLSFFIFLVVMRSVTLKELLRVKEILGL
jgi:O-antigen/teichoic acid export membrane protein